MIHNPRTPQCEVASMFVDRWSPRAFSCEPLTEAQLQSLFEAARWAPSCFNEQPWLFLYARSETDRQRFLGLLVEKNQAWARQAPLLLFVLARRRFAATERDNRHAGFDAGAAWLSLALQARRLGFYAHAMAGFDLERAYAELAVPAADYEIIAAVAVGYRAREGEPVAAAATGEEPNQRKPLAQIACQGSFPSI